MRKQQNDPGDDGGFFDCVINVRNRLEPIETLLEHPVFTADLRRICLAIAPNADDAEELFNDVCMKLTRKIDQFDPSHDDASFVGWLRTVTKNLNTDRIRRKSLELDDTPSDERYDLSDPGVDPYEQLWQDELTQKLNELIANQEEPKRLMLTYYFQDFSFRDIQKILKREHGINKTHVTVRNVVKKLLKEFFDSKVSLPALDRKANRLSRAPVVKAQMNRKAEKISRRRLGRVSHRRPALKK